MRETVNDRVRVWDGVWDGVWSGVGGLGNIRARAVLVGNKTKSQFLINIMAAQAIDRECLFVYFVPWSHLGGSSMPSTFFWDACRTK